MIHTGGEQIQGNETRNFRDWGPRIGKKGGGGWASWTAQALFAWTRTHDEPGNSETCGYIAAGLLRSGVTFGHRAPARFWTVGAKALVACSMPASVYSRVARKRKFSTLSLRSAVENGSYLAARSSSYLSFGKELCTVFQQGVDTVQMVILRSKMNWLASILTERRRKERREKDKSKQKHLFNEE